VHKTVSCVGKKHLNMADRYSHNFNVWELMYGNSNVFSYSKNVKSREKKQICTCHVSIDRSLKYIVSKLETSCCMTHESLFCIVI
jgi:hypothetical protein